MPILQSRDTDGFDRLPRSMKEEGQSLIFEFANGWCVLVEQFDRGLLPTNHKKPPIFEIWVKHPKITASLTGEAEFYRPDREGIPTYVWGDAALVAELVKYACEGVPRKHSINGAFA